MYNIKWYVIKPKMLKFYSLKGIAKVLKVDTYPLTIRGTQKSYQIFRKWSLVHWYRGIM